MFDLAFGAQKNAEKAQAKGASTDSWGTSAAAQHVTHMSLHDSDSAEKKGKAAGPTTTSNMYVARLFRIGWFGLLVPLTDAIEPFDCSPSIGLAVITALTRWGANAGRQKSLREIQEEELAAAKKLEEQKASQCRAFLRPSLPAR